MQGRQPSNVAYTRRRNSERERERESMVYVQEYIITFKVAEWLRTLASRLKPNTTDMSSCLNVLMWQGSQTPTQSREVYKSAHYNSMGFSPPVSLVVMIYVHEK